MTLSINGRFLTQPVSGVQRYAREILGALDAELAASPSLRTALGRVEVLVPYQAPLPEWQVIRTRVVPGGRGHLWEQGALYRASRAGVLVSLGNTGPLLHRAHVLCLHDANLFEIPQAFSRGYRAAHLVLRPRLARRAAALLTVSRFSAEALAWYLGLSAERFTIVPNSAEHVLRWPDDPAAPGRYGLVTGGYLLAVGNQSVNKNIGPLIEAHAGSCAPDLVIVGGAVPGVAHKGTGGAQARVHVLGRVPDADLRGLYAGAAGFVFPSLYEGFGIPPLEAAQLGVPVLCARSGAMPDVMGEAPLWFDPQDVNAMRAALDRFAQLPPPQRAAMIEKGLLRAQHFTWRDSALRLSEVILRVQSRPDTVCKSLAATG